MGYIRQNEASRRVAKPKIQGLLGLHLGNFGLFRDFGLYLGHFEPISGGFGLDLGQFGPIMGVLSLVSGHFCLFREVLAWIWAILNLLWGFWPGFGPF